MRNDQLAVMLRDFGRRCLQWADVMDGSLVHELTFEDTGLVAPPPLPPTELPPSSQPSLPWRRGDYFFCEGCGTRKQWFKDTPPWRGAICATCYNAELARIEAARGKKA